MKILICNDDGIESGGLKILAEKLAVRHEVLVVAPDGNRSCCSHTLSLNVPIKIKERNDFKGCRAYEISGFPVDCVKVGFHYVKDFEPDVVVSGINKAHNLGTDVMYSGTVAIAVEASYFGKTSFAFSAYSHCEIDFSVFADIAVKIVEKFAFSVEPGTVFNVNFPPEDKKISGIRFCPLGRYVYDDKYVEEKEGYVLKSSAAKIDSLDRDSDVFLIESGYVTITPLLTFTTDKEKIREISNLCEELL